MATTTDFGNKGKRTAEVDLNAVEIDSGGGEFLYYKLEAEGARPVFSFADENRTLLGVGNAGDVPKPEYTWKLGAQGFPTDSADEVYGVAMLFTAIVRYHLVVEARNSAGLRIKILKDIKYESQDPTDQFQETLSVFDKSR